MILYLNQIKNSYSKAERQTYSVSYVDNLRIILSSRDTLVVRYRVPRAVGSASNPFLSILGEKESAPKLSLVVNRTLTRRSCVN